MIDTWFTADTHFHHSKVIDFTSRPFKSVEEMNETLIDNWNSVVKPKDEIYHLGDVSFGSREQTIAILNRLNGNIGLIRGNHDIKRIKRGTFNQFAWVKDYHELSQKRYGQKIVLLHYPLQTWNQSHRGSYSIHGHEHGGLSNVVNGVALRRLDAAVEAHDFAPVNFEIVKEYMESIDVEMPNNRSL